MNEPISEIYARLAAPFFLDGADRVYVHDCCGWVVVALVPQQRCSECQQAPNSWTVLPTDIGPDLAE